MYKGVGANTIRPYHTIEVIRFLCVSPKHFLHALPSYRPYLPTSHLAPDKLAVKIMTIKSTTLIVTGGLNPRLIAKVY
jgi:succinate dehydrogenase/fumarate reductase-like Fe-S protein